MSKDLTDEIRKLNNRISELEKMLSAMMQPFRKIQDTTSNYMRLIGLLLERGGITPDLVIPEIKDPISKDIIQVLIERKEQNISQITELVRSKRGTASRRIIRDKINELIEKDIIIKQQKGSLYVYSLTEEVIKKWSKLLGIDI